MSDNTGGRAFPASNEFVSQAPQILRESGHFYLLGYSATNPREDGRFRRLQVRVNRPGVTVKTKAGYYEPDRDARPSPELPPATAAALAGLLPKSDLPLRATAAVIRRARLRRGRRRYCDGVAARHGCRRARGRSADRSASVHPGRQRPRRAARRHPPRSGQRC